MKHILNEKIYLNNEMARQSDERSNSLVQLNLDRYKETMNDDQCEVKIALNGGQCQERQVCFAFSMALSKSCCGNIVVPYYNHNNGPNQLVYLYNGSCWEQIDKQMFQDFIRDCCYKVNIPGEKCEDPRFQSKLISYVLHSVSRSRQHVVPKGETWVNFCNCTLEIKRDGSLVKRSHVREDNFSWVLPYAYDPNADCPLWKKFLDDVLPDESMQRILQEFAAYVLMPHHDFEKFLALQGMGSNGKSVVMYILSQMYGKQNVSALTLSDITKDPEARGKFIDKLVNISSEDDHKPQAATLKKMTTGEPLTARVLYVGTIDMTSYGKLIVSYNIMPRVENTEAYRRRMLLLKFTKTIDKKHQDTALKYKLEEELPGIMNWVLEAVPRLYSQRQFSDCEASDRAVQEYVNESDTVQLFISENCEVCSTPMLAKPIYDAFQCFCNEEFIYPVMGRRAFYDKLRHLGYKVTGDKVKYVNLKLKE